MGMSWSLIVAAGLVKGYWELLLKNKKKRHGHRSWQRVWSKVIGCQLMKNKKEFISHYHVRETKTNNQTRRPDLLPNTLFLCLYRNPQVDSVPDKIIWFAGIHNAPVFPVYVKFCNGFCIIA